MSRLLKDKPKQESREQYAYKYYLNLGYTPAQSSAIVGNLVHESGLKTDAEGDKGYVGGSSFGIAQWRGDRLKNLKKKYGNKWTDLDNQLEFVDWELRNTHKSAGEKLRKASSIHEAGKIVSDKYEVPAKKWADNKDRQDKVLNIGKKYANLKIEDLFIPKVTQGVTNYDNSEINYNFANRVKTDGLVQVDESKAIKETKDEKIATEVLDQKQAEENFVKEYFQQQEQQVSNLYQSQQNQQQDFQLPDINQEFSQISNFIDTPLAQQGGEIDWVNDWRKNRQLIPQELRNIPLNSNQVVYRDIPQEQGYITRGEYLPNEDLITLNKNLQGNLKGVISHESAHQWKDMMTEQQRQKYISDPILQQYNPEQLERYLKGSEEEQYYTNPWEVHGEVMKVRYNENFKPNQEIKIEDIQKIKNKEQYKFGDLTNEQLKNIFNLTADINNLQNSKNYVQQGGNIPVSSRGVYDYPNAKQVIVPTKFGEITMRNVKYPILGIDEFGNAQVMLPNQEYKYQGKTILEIPLRNDR